MVMNQKDLKKRALIDLSNRAKGGIVIYLLIWLLITVPHQFPDILPVFFYLNTSILVAIATVRLLHLYMLKRRPDLPVLMMKNWLVYTVLFAALQWGVMGAWVLIEDKAVDVRNMIIVVTAAFAIGGSAALNISKEIRIFYPILIFSPGIIVLIYQGSSGGWELAGLATLAVIYAIGTTKITHNDYWESITNQAIAEDRANMMEQLSNTDQLTQLKNRLYFDNKFNEEWQRSSRMSAPLSILLMDLDNFKKLNDTYGHLFGDECLRLIASRISSELVRASDCVARYGGEEFVALLPNTGEDEMRTIAEKLVLAVSSAGLKSNDKKIQLTCSIGGATTFPDYKDDKEFLLKQADIALYRAKNNGRNQFQPYEPGFQAAT
jgi:diguanylate cyclase (GGDEF)-like protein